MNFVGVKKMNRYNCILVLIFGTAFAITSGSASGNLIVTAGTPTLTGNSANNTAGTVGELMRQNLSSIAVTNAGGSVASSVGSFVDSSVRYAYVNVIDRDNNGGGAGETKTHAWQISFDVTAPAGHTYDLAIDTSRIGALTVRRDNSNAIGFGRADLRAMVGAYSGPGTVSGTLNLAAIEPGLQLSPGNPSTTETVVNQNTTLNVTGITGTGAAQTISLGFSWTTAVETTGGISFVSSSHEGAVRMGMVITSFVSNILAGGAGGTGTVPFREVSNDGHFLNLRATITAVPEPSSALLALSGLIGLAGFRRRLA